MCHWKRLQEIGRKKCVRLQAPVGLHVSLGPPAVNGVGEMQWQSPTADRFLPVSVRVQSPSVLFMPLMECVRPVSSRSTRIGVCARGLREDSLEEINSTGFLLVSHSMSDSY
ncbi:hypothetical protein AVEN_215111-1 [Araneus ventricosus]|uniref:Uncharacterized protein n=1 Tax=Araneus ventricosus TaxID=182803 RepID=A0A4Y2RNR5_ARAVE|nr:hypothetical protein AVEN_215111-1 [Araneus ventricosus]